MTTIECGSLVRRLFLHLALAVLPASVLAQTADRPDVKVGDRWVFAVTSGTGGRSEKLYDRVWVVTSVAPTGIEGTENGQPLMLTPDLNVVDSPRRHDSDRRLLSFPLEVGKQWSFTDYYLWKDVGYNGRGDGAVIVVGQEKLRVPAGEFEVLKLEARIPFRVPPEGPVTGETTLTYWYASKARAIVKEETRDPHRGLYGFELIEFKLQP